MDIDGETLGILRESYGEIGPSVARSGIGLEQSEIFSLGATL